MYTSTLYWREKELQRYVPYHVKGKGRMRVLQKCFTRLIDRWPRPDENAKVV